MEPDEEVDLKLEPSPEEKAELGLTLQETYIDFWRQHQDQDPTAEDFQNFMNRVADLHGRETSKIVNTAFGSYNDFIRSLGDIPQYNLTPQDAGEKVFRYLEPPATISRLEQQDHSSEGFSQRYFGSHSIMMEAIGFFDEYRQMLLGVKGGQNDSFEQILERRERDRESLIKQVERDLGKDYDEVETKYSTE